MHILLPGVLFTPHNVVQNIHLFTLTSSFQEEHRQTFAHEAQMYQPLLSALMEAPDSLGKQKPSVYMYKCVMCCGIVQINLSQSFLVRTKVKMLHVYLLGFVTGAME